MCHPERGIGLDKSEAGDRFQVTVTSLPLNKLAKSDLVILVLFLVILGLREGPLRSRMGDAPP